MPVVEPKKLVMGILLLGLVFLEVALKVVLEMLGFARLFARLLLRHH